jgi:hypothetical protein
MSSGRSSSDRAVLAFACLVTFTLAAVVFTIIGIAVQARWEIIQPRISSERIEEDIHDFPQPGPLPIKSE